MQYYQETGANHEVTRAYRVSTFFIPQKGEYRDKIASKGERSERNIPNREQCHQQDERNEICIGSYNILVGI